MDPDDFEEEDDDEVIDGENDYGISGTVVDCFHCEESFWHDQTKPCLRCEERFCGVCHDNHPCM